MPKPTDFVQRRGYAFIPTEIASDDVCGLGRWTRRPFTIEAHRRVVFSDVINERTADQPTAVVTTTVSRLFSIVDVVFITPALLPFVMYPPDLCQHYKASGDKPLPPRSHRSLCFPIFSAMAALLRPPLYA